MSRSASLALSAASLGLGLILPCVLSLLLLATGSPWRKPGSELLVLPGLFMIPVALLALPLLAIRRARRAAGVVALASGALAAGTILGIMIDGSLRMHAFSGAALRARPLVAAIRQFEAEHARPPDRIEDLLTEYLQAIPDRLPPLELV